jgi:hypothetical protein
MLPKEEKELQNNYDKEKEKVKVKDVFMDRFYSWGLGFLCGWFALFIIEHLSIVLSVK